MAQQQFRFPSSSCLQQIVLVVFVLVLSLSSFSSTTTSVQAFTPTTVASKKLVTTTTSTTRLYEENGKRIERGVSVDQDGKSNVWAIEPKVEIEQKSNEESTTSALFAVGGLAIFGIGAAIILTNLPDPNQF